MELWICGQLLGEWNKERFSWAFQGAFTSEAKADAACRDENYFIFPVELDQELPHETVIVPRGRYPRLE